MARPHGARGASKAVLPVALAALLAIPAATRADVLYDQTTGVPGQTVPSSLGGTPASSEAAAADDFIVPPRLIWELSSVDVGGQASSTQTAHVIILADGGGLPGVELFREDGIPLPTGFTQGLPLPGAPPLPPGHYWLSVYSTSSGGGWSWRRQSPTTGYPAVWGSPLNGARSGCTTFRPLPECGFGAAEGTDLVFRLNGAAVTIAKRRRARCKRRRAHPHQAVDAKRKRCKKRRRQVLIRG